MMEQRISLVTLGGRDLAASKRFYADGLGWKPAFENKEIIFFQTGGMIFALFLRDDLFIPPTTMPQVQQAEASRVPGRNFKKKRGMDRF